MSELAYYRWSAIELSLHKLSREWSPTAGGMSLRTRRLSVSYVHLQASPALPGGVFPHETAPHRTAADSRKCMTFGRKLYEQGLKTFHSRSRYIFPKGK